MSFNIIRGDIINIKAEAIVRMADQDPEADVRSDEKFYGAAGRFRLSRVRKKIGIIAAGEAVYTPAFRLKAKYIIHTVCPVWTGGDSGEPETLSGCYRNSLLTAQRLKCKSIAFPLIDSEDKGFPRSLVLDAVLEEFRSFLKNNDMDIILVVPERVTIGLSETLSVNVESYIGDNYIYRRRFEDYSCESESMHKDSEPITGSHKPYVFRKTRRLSAARDDMILSESDSLSDVCYAPSVLGECQESKRKKSLEDIVLKVGENFREMLFRLIDERGLSDSEVYKKANIDRKLFSKIRCNEDYIPKKQTVLAFVFALELNLDETVDLISRAGMALSPGSKFDLILSYCIENGIYDLFEVNSLLFEYGQPLLGE